MRYGNYRMQFALPVSMQRIVELLVFSEKHDHKKYLRLCTRTHTQTNARTRSNFAYIYLNILGCTYKRECTADAGFVSILCIHFWCC